MSGYFGPGEIEELPAGPLFIQGMSLRDWFAGQALASLVRVGGIVEDSIAEEAYVYADAMLEARGAGTTAEQEHDER